MKTSKLKEKLIDNKPKIQNKSKARNANDLKWIRYLSQERTTPSYVHPTGMKNVRCRKKVCEEGGISLTSNLTTNIRTTVPWGLNNTYNKFNMWNVRAHHLLILKEKMENGKSAPIVSWFSLFNNQKMFHKTTDFFHSISTANELAILQLFLSICWFSIGWCVSHERLCHYRGRKMHFCDYS